MQSFIKKNNIYPLLRIFHIFKKRGGRQIFFPAKGLQFFFFFFRRPPTRYHANFHPNIPIITPPKVCLYVRKLQPQFSQYHFFEHKSYAVPYILKLNGNRQLYQWFSWTILYTLDLDQKKFWISEKLWWLFVALSEGIPKVFGKTYSPSGSCNISKSGFFF